MRSSTIRGLSLALFLMFSGSGLTVAPALALQHVPVILQGYNDCGPASIGMVLGYYGINIPAKAISQATKPSPDAYMSVNVMAPFFAQYGLETVTVVSGQLDPLKRLVALGVPTIALQYYREVGKVPHFRVVRGYDDRQNIIYVVDPLIGEAYMSYKDFDMLWNTQGRTFVAIYPPRLRSQVMQTIRGKTS